MSYSSPSYPADIGQQNHRTENGRARELYNNNNNNNSFGSAGVHTGYQPGSGTAEQTEKYDSQNTVKSENKSGSLKQNGAANGNLASPQTKYNQAYEVKWDDDEGRRDPMNPYNKSELRKWIILFVVSMSAFCV